MTCKHGETSCVCTQCDLESIRRSTEFEIPAAEYAKIHDDLEYRYIYESYAEFMYKLNKKLRDLGNG